jgi:hypothetical protein
MVTTARIVAGDRRDFSDHSRATAADELPADDCPLMPPMAAKTFV